MSLFVENKSRVNVQFIGLMELRLESGYVLDLRETLYIVYEMEFNFFIET